jgi:membrane associated rhomboid family serine protease
VNQWDENFLVSMKNVREGRWWVMLTSSFAHKDILHLGVNMFTLWQLGRPMVMRFGAKALAGTWIVSALGCSALHLYWPSLMDEAVRCGYLSRPIAPFEDRPALGASGSICGLLGFLTCVAPRSMLPQTALWAGFSIYCTCVCCSGYEGLANIC